MVQGLGRAGNPCRAVVGDASERFARGQRSEEIRRSGGVWGLGRTVMTEQPELGARWWTWSGSAIGRGDCAGSGASGRREPGGVAWGQRHVARLVRASRPLERAGSADYSS